MRRILTVLFMIITSIYLIASNETTYRDVSKEHWAYYSIENLINKGILEVDSDYFNGEVKTTKNDLVYYLSKVLNKLDETKADKDDLLIIENLIYEFSNELNEFGMDIENYKSKIDNLQNNIKPTNKKIQENEKKISEINEILKKTSQTANEESIKNSPYDEFGNIDIQFKSELIKNNLEKDSDELENLKYKKDYELQVNYILDQGEISLLKRSENESLQINSKGKKNILDNLKIGFHLGEYITDVSSYTKTLNYNNYDRDKNRFYSNNIFLESDNLTIYSEERKEEVELILDIDTEYMKTYYQRNLENVLNNYELSFVYSKIENFSISISYVNEEKKEEEKINYKYALSQLEYSDEKKDFKIGYEHKIEDEPIYNNFFGKANYEVIEGSHLGYELEILDTPINSSFLYNNKIKLENITENSDIRFEINKIKIEKEDINLGEEDIHKYEYLELIAKLRYNIKEKYGIKMSYLIKTMQESKENKTITYIMPYYKVNKNTEIFIKYMEKRYATYNDTKKNIDGEYYNMNFDKEKGILRNGDLVSFGIDMKF